MLFVFLANTNINLKGTGNKVKSRFCSVLIEKNNSLKFFKRSFFDRNIFFCNAVKLTVVTNYKMTVSRSVNIDFNSEVGAVSCGNKCGVCVFCLNSGKSSARYYERVFTVKFYGVHRKNFLFDILYVIILLWKNVNLII